MLDLSTDLPLVLEWIDQEGRVEALLPELEKMVQGGMITIDSVTVVRHQPHPDGRR
jgi:PII-like signaling protein